jgi:hypothetical protein
VRMKQMRELFSRSGLLPPAAAPIGKHHDG